MRATGQVLWRRWRMRRNPFGEPPSSEHSWLFVGKLDPIVAWWRQGPRRALQWIGPCGHGKSAHLAGLRAREPELVYVYLPERGPRPELPAAVELLVDEAQRLPRSARRRLYRRSERLALATHRDLRGELEAAGWRVRTFEVGCLGIDRLSRILARRIAWARGDSRSARAARREEVRALHGRFGGDLRRLFDHLYETFEHPTLTNPWRSEDGSM